MSEEQEIHTFATSVSGLPEGSPVFPYLELNHSTATATAHLSEEESYATSWENLIRWIAEQIKTIEGTDNDNGTC